MMKVTRNVILDLLPVYHAGEASDDTRRLITAFADSDLQVAKLVRQPPSNPLPPLPTANQKEIEMIALTKTKTLLKWRTVILLAAGIFTGLTLLFFASTALGFLLLDPAMFLTWGPIVAIFGVLAALLAAGMWTGYFVFVRSFGQ